jgi:eukaryotic-like serine/threonine-protein kinase
MLDRVVTGSEIDGFAIGERIHSGAMGNIFRVTRAGMTAPMIMKVPRVGPDEPTEGIISFETEATIVPALSGPHVPRFVAAGDLARTPYLVTEWVDGISLEAVLRGGPLPPDEVVRVGAAIADALHSLHRQDAIHLDIKPANIILRKDGIVALVDFGFAHHTRFPDLLAEETRFGAGSAPYISPEQVLGTREDPRSDIFSLGVVLYEMATGRFPFGEPDTDVRNRLWLDPAPPSALVPALSPWLQEIILRCLEPKAELRYQTAALVAFDLRNPEQLTLTARATKSKRARLFQQVRRFLKARGEYGRRSTPPHVRISRSPIIMVAVDTTNLDDERQPAIQRATAQVMSVSKEFRLIAVSVFPSPPPKESAGTHLEHLVRLRHWVDPIAVTKQRLSLHAIESSDPAGALVDFARFNHVDLIILGAPGTKGSWSQSVASTVTANAPCSVHVVRVPEGRISA